MANLSTFPARATVEAADQFVGYRAATSGGEGRWTAATLRAWVQAFTTKSSIGLGSVDNTADSAKPVSTAQAAAISAAQAAAIATAAADATTKANAAEAAAIAAIGPVQPLDADLTAIAALTTTSFGRTFLTLADAAATRSALGLVIDSNVQSYSARLAALAGLSTAADTLPYFTGASTAALATFTSTGRTLVAAADAAAGRSALGLVIGTHVQAYSSALATYAAIPPSANVQGFLAAANYAAMRTALGAGAASGLSTLDAGGKIPTAQIPDAVLGQVKFQGTWNAATNTPTLSGTPAATTKGDYYIVSTGGTQFSKTFDVGDWIISNGATQDKIDNTDAVTTVAGRIGNVTLTASDLTDGTAAGRTLFTAATAAAQRTALALVVGTDVQAYSANLAALAGITSAADRLPYFTGSGTATYANFTSYGRTLVAAADAAAGRTALGLGTLALQAANNVAITGGAINGTPIGATTPSTVAATSLSTTGNVTLGGGADFFNGSVRISDNASSTAPAYFQSGEPGISGSNVILSNNYFGTSGGASGRKNSSVGASYIRLNVGSASTSNTTLGFISASGTSTDVASFSSTGASITGALSVSGNATFSGGTNQRLFVNTTGASAPNRLAFQESTTNGSLALFGLPNGTSLTATLGVADDSAYTNGIRVRLSVSGGSAFLISDAFGTGTAQPLQIQAQGVVSGIFSSTGLAVIGTLTTSSTTLHTSSVSLTNGAAAALGTLTNAPTAGNPTKWIPIVDNGTPRYIPAW
jgi:hypothetical protein